jgi:hypothetical protein
MATFVNSGSKARFDFTFHAYDKLAVYHRLQPFALAAEVPQCHHEYNWPGKYAHADVA